jgi:hypothetical protein
VIDAVVLLVAVKVVREEVVKEVVTLRVDVLGVKDWVIVIVWVKV